MLHPTAVYVHHLPQLLQQLRLDPDLAQAQGSHIAVSTLVLLAPGCIALGAHGLAELADAMSALMPGAHLFPSVFALFLCEMLIFHATKVPHRIL